jgi:hypothetical protein
MQSVRVSPDTIILGSNHALYWALQRLKLPLQPSASLKEAQQLAPSYPIWALGKPAAFATFGKAMVSNASVTKVKFGASLRDQFQMDMILGAASPLAAKRLLENSSKGAPRDVRAAIEGSSVHYWLLLDRASTLDRFAGIMTDSVAKQLAPLLTAARQMASPPVRPTLGKAVIEGLDNGPREVSLEPNE